MAHIGVSVTDETKSDWEDYVEESSYGSISELVRSAVRKEIRRDSGGDGVPREVERELTQVAETQQTLQAQMDDLLDGFDGLSEAVDTGPEYPEEVIEIGHDIAGELEEVPARGHEEEVDQTRRELHNLGKPYGATPGQVHDALQYLADNLSYIQRRPLGPSDYYRVRG